MQCETLLGLARESTKKRRNKKVGECITTIRYNVIHVQWNPSIAATLGEQNLGRYIGAAFIEGLFCIHIWDLDSWQLYRGGFIQGWPFAN